MLKPTNRSKLALNRQTVMPLQPADLSAANGGTSPAGPAIFMASVRFCAAVGGAILGSAQRSCVTCRCQ
jgi:hypothetical protein